VIICLRQGPGRDISFGVIQLCSWNNGSYLISFCIVLSVLWRFILESFRLSKEWFKPVVGDRTVLSGMRRWLGATFFQLSFHAVEWRSF